MDWNFVKSKFDNISLMILIGFLVCLLTWVDKHGNSDFEKWLEVFAAGFGGAYLGLITAARQAWEKKVTQSDDLPPHIVSQTTTSGTTGDATASPKK